MCARHPRAVLIEAKSRPRPSLLSRPPLSFHFRTLSACQWRGAGARLR
jgi:hypothetical protein